jgi:hypothetical protein
MGRMRGVRGNRGVFYANITERGESVKLKD